MEDSADHIEPTAHEIFAQRDAYMASHCDRVGLLTLVLAQQSGLSGKDQVVLAAAARLHDIGKRGLPDAIRRKPGPLDDDEWAIMQSHSERGERLVRADLSLPWREDIALVIRHHHENFDGSGYPDGLRGRDIPRLARVLSVADTYVAITESRAYHAAQTHQQAMAILVAERGRKYDPDIVNLMLSLDEKWLTNL